MREHSPQPQHHSRSLAICADVRALIERTKNLPAHGWSPEKGWHFVFGPAWEAEGRRICDEYDLDPSQFLAFVRFVRGQEEGESHA